MSGREHRHRDVAPSFVVQVHEAEFANGERVKLDLVGVDRALVQDEKTTRDQRLDLIGRSTGALIRHQGDGTIVYDHGRRVILRRYQP